MLDVQLYGPEVTDEQVRHLVRLPKLRSLKLEGTSVTQQGLRELEKLPELKRLDVWDAQAREPAKPPNIGGAIKSGRAGNLELGVKNMLRLNELAHVGLEVPLRSLRA